MWNHVVTKKVLNKSKYILYLRFFKVATLCLDDSFVFSQPASPGLIPTVLKDFPHMLSICWLLFLHSVVQLITTIPIGLRLGDCGGQVI